MTLCSRHADIVVLRKVLLLSVFSAKEREAAGFSEKFVDKYRTHKYKETKIEEPS
jgi:hypothetical protein